SSGRAVSARRLCRAAARSGARRGADAASAGGRGDRVKPSLSEPLGSPGISRLSFNQITAGRASLADAVDACARHGVPYIAVWRHKLAETGLERAVRLVSDAGVGGSRVWCGGKVPAWRGKERGARNGGIGRTDDTGG